MKNPTEHSLFSRFEILPRVKFCIVIPVKDEEEYILRNLTSFTKQVDLSGNPFNHEEFEILILANNCSDQSVTLIRHFQETHTHLNIYLEEITLSPIHANIGYVRRKLMDCAYSRLSANGGGIMMTTDGDTMVAEDWISQTDWEMNNGADVVGGRILLYDDELKNLDKFTKLCHFKDEKYQLLIAELEGKIMKSAHDPLPRHHQHFNGSFAIKTDCYKISGGIPKVEFLEDCAFFDRLQRIDAKIRHSMRVKVYTSARYIGRATVGLSYQLNVWKNLAHDIDNYFVESFSSIVERFTLKRKLMTIWESKKQSRYYLDEIINKIAPDIMIDAEFYDSLNRNTYFGEWYENILSTQHTDHMTKYPEVSIVNAIADLEAILQEYSNHTFSQTSIL
jgi:glycosyltransferase involved in cell wall biosynthesis